MTEVSTDKMMLCQKPFRVDAVGGGVDVAEREAAAVVLEGADRDGHHRRDQEQRHVNPEGDDARGPAQPAQQLR
jgi:hypothetical protein